MRWTIRTWIRIERLSRGWLKKFCKQIPPRGFSLDAFPALIQRALRPAAFAFLHLALATAANLAFAAALIRRVGLAPVDLPALLNAAHRFRTPALMFASP